MNSVIRKYFPDLSETQHEQYHRMEALYHDWNSKINVISRKDIEHLYERHVLHSLAIAKVVRFAPRTRVIDAGTGGGFPGIPLAIFFPEVNFHLVDSIGKKIMVVKEICSALGLKNVSAEKSRLEDLKVNFDFAVSRSVAPLNEMVTWLKPLIVPGSKSSLANGMIFLKGGDLESELKGMLKKTSTFEISAFFEGEFFQTKKVLYLGV